MKKLLNTTVLTAVITITVASFAQAKETTTREELIGYKVTTAQIPGKAGAFLKVDANNNGWISWDEFQNAATLDNEYNVFITMDKDGNDMVDVYEYSAFNKTKGETVTKSDGEHRVEVDGHKMPQVTYAETRYVPVKTYNFNQD